MSIYVLRYGDLYKIGYSSDLRQRVSAIMQGIPGQVAFVGHMPGDKDLEAHLHGVFASARFSGEWFRETAELRSFCNIVLDPELPTPLLDRSHGNPLKQLSIQRVAEMRDRLREYAFKRWPRLTHSQRRLAITKELGWKPSRVRSVYYGDVTCVLRHDEVMLLEEFLSRTEDLVIGAPATTPRLPQPSDD